MQTVKAAQDTTHGAEAKTCRRTARRQRRRPRPLAPRRRAGHGTEDYRYDGYNRTGRNTLKG